MPATTVFLRYNQLAFGWNEVFVGAIYSFTMVAPPSKPVYRKRSNSTGGLNPLAQQAVQQAGITAVFGDRMFTAFCAAWQILKVVTILLFHRYSFPLGCWYFPVYRIGCEHPTLQGWFLPTVVSRRECQGFFAPWFARSGMNEVSQQ